MGDGGAVSVLLLLSHDGTRSSAEDDGSWMMQYIEIVAYVLGEM